MRRIVGIIISSVPEMFNTLFFFSFFLISISIIGMQLFSGTVHQRCRLSSKAVNATSWPIDPNQQYKICTIVDPQNPITEHEFKKNSHKYCDPGTFCAKPLDTEAMNAPWQDEVIGYYTQSYDDFLQSLITVFQALTLEEWATHLTNLVNSGYAMSATIFYLFVVFFGSYFILNLILAVVMSSYIKYQDIFAETRAQERKIGVGGSSDRKISRIAPEDQTEGGQLEDNRTSSKAAVPKSSRLGRATGKVNDIEFRELSLKRRDEEGIGGDCGGESHSSESRSDKMRAQVAPFSTQSIDPDHLQQNNTTTNLNQ